MRRVCILFALLIAINASSGGDACEDRSGVNFDQGERRDRTLDYDNYEQSDESLVDDYLEKNSRVDCSSATIPLLKPKKKKIRKSKKSTTKIKDKIRFGAGMETHFPEEKKMLKNSMFEHIFVFFGKLFRIVF